jgi:hypothetical protein
MHEYTINGVCYEQTPIVLGQTIQLAKIMASVEGEITDLASFISVAGDRLPELMAVVLTPKGGSKRGKDITRLADEFHDHATLEDMEAVVSDFFTCNPNIPSLLQKIENMTGVVGNLIGRVTLRLLSNSFASSLHEATSPNETPSCGESDQTK